MTAHAAARAIREADPAAGIGMLGDEPVGPYARPPLSKALWTGQEEGTIWLPPVEGLTLRTGAAVAAIDPPARRVRLRSGEEVGYERLLLATGGSPRRVAAWGDGVVYFRTLADQRRLRALPAGSRVVVVGGGFIGSELAASLTSAGYQVTLVFPEDGIGARLFPRDLSDHVTREYTRRGVHVRPSERVLGVTAQADRSIVALAGGEVSADAVVAGLGLVPGTALAEGAGLTVDDGVVVDELLRTSHPEIWAAGDVARFPSVLGGKVRVEHEDNAITMGRHAGLSMAGAGEPYRHLPFFYSDLFDAGYEAVGRIDARLEVVAEWEEPFRKGVLEYRDGGRVVGVLTWGIFGRMEEARARLRASAARAG
jgi:NADPH-dependent 2,4-dienoyl-CoA reductase/sulfur reductase-like enzyme